MTDHVLIALQHQSGSISRMQFGVRRRRAHLDDGVALQNGFVLDEQGNWTREPTVELVTREIGRTVWATPVVKWWRINDGDHIPERTRARPISQPTEDDPLPRFLKQGEDVAPDMLARAKEFESKVVAVLEQSRKVMDASHMDVTQLAERISNVEATLANLAAAVKTAREGREE
jgi:hypothetical protein